jgi:hypothetical protein
MKQFHDFSESVKKQDTYGKIVGPKLFQVEFHLKKILDAFDSDVSAED